MDGSRNVDNKAGLEMGDYTSRSLIMPCNFFYHYTTGVGMISGKLSDVRLCGWIHERRPAECQENERWMISWRTGRILKFLQSKTNLAIYIKTGFENR